MDWDSLGPISLGLTAVSAAVGGAIKWVDSIRQRRRAQVIEALKFSLEAEKKQRAEAEARHAKDLAETEVEREQYRAAYFSARSTLRAYEKQLLAAGIKPDPSWEEPNV